MFEKPGDIWQTNVAGDVGSGDGQFAQTKKSAAFDLVFSCARWA